LKTVIKARGLKKSYGTTLAVDGLDIELEAGLITGLIGADGAGKTSTIRILLGLEPHDEGQITVEGVTDSARWIRLNAGYMPEHFSLYQDLTVEENLAFFGSIHGLDDKEYRVRRDWLYSFSRLQEFSARRAGYLSGGMKQKLALSCALMHSPLVLFLDEPTTGVDPVSRMEFWNMLKELAATGVAILIATPNLDEAEDCDRVLILDRGKLIKKGSPHQLAKELEGKLYLIDTGAAHDIIEEKARITSHYDTLVVYLAPDGLRLYSPSGMNDEHLAKAGIKVAGPAPARLEDVFCVNVLERSHE
jgi:ABC-2 type transport system ATP-binding protein